jgi:acyl-CoA synthetase (AMP-forming)/AMP-acid ligase II
LNGAEPISDIVQQRFVERFSKWGFSKDSLLPVYGLSEASLAVTFTRRGTASRTVHHQGRDVMSVGTPMPGTKVEVRDGRIWVQSPSVMQKYCGNVEATRKSLVNHWLDTGDLGFVDGGELFISGRAKDIVIIRGANYAPQVFEECVDGIPGARAGCVVAVGYTPAGCEGEKLAILVEGEGERLKEAVSGAIVARTSIRPHVVVVLSPGTLPRTSSGKLRRSEALRRWQAGELTPPKPVTALQMSTEIAKSLWSFTKSQLR